MLITLMHDCQRATPHFRYRGRHTRHAAMEMSSAPFLLMPRAMPCCRRYCQRFTLCALMLAVSLAGMPLRLMMPPLPRHAMPR